jgi:hypothetical protein
MVTDELKGIQIYELKLEIREVKPLIWRRLLVPGNITLAQLHEVIQTAMGWTNSHLHQFVVENHSYSDPELEIDESRSEYRYSLAKLAPRVRDLVFYLYDFGDGWEHRIRVERIIEDDKRYPGKPICLAGARNCPPEDCGGPWGYQNFLRAIGEKHKEHKELLRWIGGRFDPEHFDLNEVNELLRKIDLRPR